MQFLGKFVCWRLPLEGWRPLLQGILDPPLHRSYSNSHTDRGSRQRFLTSCNVFTGVFCPQGERGVSAYFCLLGGCLPTGGLCPEESLSGGYLDRGVLCPGGASVLGVSGWRPPPPGSHCSIRCASYWNAFLFMLFQLINVFAIV